MRAENVMMSIAGDRRAQIFCLACGLSVLGIALLYIAQWLQMPLYPDEVALRLWKARFLADGPIEYSVLPQCPSNAKEIPTILRPAAYLFSVFDLSYSWSLVREIPSMGIFLALGICLLLVFERRSPAALLIPAVGFIGAAGAGLVLFRMEVPLILYGTACAIGYYLLVRREAVGLAIVCVYLVVSTLLALFSFYIHLQSLILAPIGILLAAGVVIRQRSSAAKIMAVLSALLIAIGASTIVATPTMKCDELPKLQRFFDVMTLGGLAKHEGTNGVGEYLENKLNRYTDQFLFKRQYDHDYLPGVTSGGSNAYLLLNTAISFAVLLNLLIACGVLVYSGIGITRFLSSEEHSLREKLTYATTAPCIYLFFATSGHLALFIVDVPTNFYRASYIHLSLVMINALALSSLRGSARLALWSFGVFGVALSILSATVAREEMKPKFLAGWTGPSISLDTNWSAAQSEVTRLAGKCGIAAKDPRIIIDDLTFDAMRRHPHLMPVTYIGVAYNPEDPGVKKLPEFIRGFGATHVLARCIYFPMYKIIPDSRSNDLCCAGL
jgi:hypothetical protein